MNILAKFIQYTFVTSTKKNLNRINMNYYYYFTLMVIKIIIHHYLLFSLY